MYPCDPISFNRMKIRGEASYYYAEIKEFVKDVCVLTDFILLICNSHGKSRLCFRHSKLKQKIIFY